MPINFEALPMGFETQQTAQSIQAWRILKHSLWDLKLDWKSGEDPLAIYFEALPMGFETL